MVHLFMIQLIQHIKEILINRPVLRKVLKNISWLTFERGLQLILSVFVGIWIARYLGPSDFGLMNFAIAFGSVFGPFIGMGVSGIVLRELIKHPEKKDILSGTAFWITFVTGLMVTILMDIAILFVRPNDFEAFLVVFVFSLGNIFLSFDVIYLWFDSKIESHKTVVARNAGLILSYVLRIAFIVFGFPLIFFIIASLLDSVFRIVFYIYFYYKDKQSIFNWRFDFSLAKKLISISWPLVFSGVMIVIYMKIDQVMIGLMMNDFQVGLYSVSVKLTEVLYFLPGIIMISLLPSLINSKSISKKVYESRLQKLFDFMTWFPLFIIIPVFFFSTTIVNILYGIEYASSGIALSISVWAILPVFVKIAVENYLLNENKTKVVFLSSFLGAITNIILNLILIPLYGINGAAFATVISYLVAAYIGVLIIKDTRYIFNMLLNTFNVFRLIKKIKKDLM